MAKNNLFTATETLQRAYQAVIDDKNVSSRTKLYSNLMGLEKPSLSEILIDYYEPKNELFPTKQVNKKLAKIAQEKDKAIVDYIHTRMFRKRMAETGFNDPDEYLNHLSEEVRQTLSEAGNKQFTAEEVDAMLEKMTSDNVDFGDMTDLLSDEEQVISDKRNFLEPNIEQDKNNGKE